MNYTVNDEGFDSFTKAIDAAAAAGADVIEKIVRCDGCGGDITHEHQECVTWDDGAVEVLCDVCSGLLSADPIPSDL